MPEPILQLQGLSKRFGAVVASDGVTLDLLPGEIHALIGPNGAGKSTVIKQVAGEIRQDSGSIRFAGRDIDRLDMVARARLGLARTFQVSSVAPEFSALQNVMLAVQSVERKTFRFFKPALSEASLTEPAMSYLVRLLLEDRAEVRAGDLSHGERRALEIAIALALKPKAFLLDEPMAGMGAREHGDADRHSRRAAGGSADPAGRARHGCGVRAGGPHLRHRLRPHHRERHAAGDSRQRGGAPRLPRGRGPWRRA